MAQIWILTISKAAEEREIRNSHSLLPGILNGIIILSHKRSRPFFIIRSNLHSCQYEPKMDWNVNNPKHHRYPSFTNSWHMQKSLRCPSVGELDKVWYLQTVNHLSVLIKTLSYQTMTQEHCMIQAYAVRKVHSWFPGAIRRKGFINKHQFFYESEVILHEMATVGIVSYVLIKTK